MTGPSRQAEVLRVVAGLLACVALSGLALPARQPARGDAPRTLILALDGVPFRVAEQAREMGAFAGWPPTSRLIASFPSVTNVSFAEMFQPAGLDPSPGYEYAHFDREHNRRVHCSPFHYKQRAFPWRDGFDSIGRSLGSKLAGYTRPRKRMRKELRDAKAALLDSPEDVVLAHVGSTDALVHLRGDRAMVRAMLEVDTWIEGLRARHRDAVGRPLRIVLLSDHGNTNGKVEGASGFKRRLRGAGLQISNRLEHDTDVVATTFGLVGYGALFLDPLHAASAARAVADHPAVALAAWISGPGTLGVVSEDGAATVRWRDVDSGRAFAYKRESGDPLRLAEAAAALAAGGLLDDDGFARDRDWLRTTALAENPDALNRLVEAFTGDHLRNHATVLFSMRPGRAWGWKSAKAGSWLRGGHLEGTHGGLDRGSSVGFFLPDDADRVPADQVVRASEALTDYLDRPSAPSRVAQGFAQGATRVPSAR